MPRALVHQKAASLLGLRTGGLVLRSIGVDRYKLACMALSNWRIAAVPGAYLWVHYIPCIRGAASQAGRLCGGGRGQPQGMA